MHASFWNQWPHGCCYATLGLKGAPYRPELAPGSPEPAIALLAAYYDVPATSLRNAVLPDALHNVSGFLYEDFVCCGGNHPTPHGHKLMADMVIHQLERAAHDVILHSAPPTPGWPDWLPPPLVKGNEVEGRDAACRKGEELRDILVQNRGWGFEEGEKAGWWGNSTGAILQLRLELSSGADGIMLFYLLSWRPDMGRVSITCLTGCACAAVVVDGHGGEATVMAGQAFRLSKPAVGGEACVLALEVLSGRFKVMGLAAGSEIESFTFAWQTG